MGVIDIIPVDSGLNNQKLALLGLAAIAQEEGKRLRLPEMLVDFTPMPRGVQAPRVELPISSVFDTVKLTEILREHNLLAEGPATETRSYQECFKAGNAVVRRLTTSRDFSGAFASQFLRAFHPAPALALIAQKALKKLPLPQTLALQLRIERDWREYLLRKSRAGELSSPNVEELSTDPGRILSKVSACHDLAGRSVIFACCDEDDLEQSHAELRQIAAEHRYQLVFKSDIIGSSTPSSRLMRSVVDFSICLELDAYIGLSRSTFSNMLCLVKATSDPHPQHYIYNTPDDHVRLRRDRGLGITPQRAVGS